MATQIPPLEDRIRRSRGRASRTCTANTKVTKEEHAELEKAAKAEGKALSEWVREVLLNTAKHQVTDRAIFTELVAQRQLLTTVLEYLAVGKTMTEIQYKNLTSDLRAKKFSIATDVLAQYTLTGGK